MNYKIISSGSKGNCVIIENLMIDLGVPYKTIKDELYNIQYIFITHKHADHLQVRTYEKIRKEFPRIKIMGNWSVATSVTKPLDKIVTYKPIKLKGMVITPFEVPHDVVTHGLTIETETESAIYVTDSAGTKSWKTGKYDYLFLESNHCEHKLSMAKAVKGYDPRVSSKRHCSTQEAKAFYYMNRKDESSEWIELHKSERFY